MNILAGVLLAFGAILGSLAPAYAGHAAVTPALPAGGVVNVWLQDQVLRLENSSRHFLRNNQAQPLVRLEVTSTHDISGIVRSLGGNVKVDVGGKVTAAELPADKVAALAQQPGVRGLFPVEKYHSELDQSVPDIRANQVWGLHDTAGLPIQGQHVLVGILDGGTDYHSADFKNPDGSTRIKYIWDQSQYGNSPSGFNFGYECNASSINSGRCPERDNTDGHGTHVAGIAAGNGASSGGLEVGVAPQADIIIVRSDLSDDNIIAGWKYMIAKAQQLGEPIVINNSFGGQEGPHDGTEPDAQAIDQLAGPGRIFIKSAGNGGDQGVHVDGTLNQSSTRSLTVSASSYTSGFGFVVFYNAQDSLSLSLTNTSTGETFGPIQQDGRIDNKTSRDNDTQVTVESGAWDQRFHEAYIAVKSSSQRHLIGAWRLQMKGNTVSSGDSYNAWMLGQQDASFTGSDEADTLSIPADSQNVIAVANYATKTSWTDFNNRVHNVCDNYECFNGTLNLGDIAAYSSQGPTATGLHKPDIAAPGTMITSTLTHDIPICSNGNTNGCMDPYFVTPDGKNLTLTGTSMAAPHVAGTVALMLQANPNLDQNQVRSILQSTARHDQFTGSAPWTPTFGAGKVDALAAVEAVLGGPKPGPAPTPVPPSTNPTPVTSPPQGGPLAFNIVSVRVEKSNKQAISRGTAGRRVTLALYVAFTSIPDGSKIISEFRVIKSSNLVGYNATRGTLNHGDTGTYRIPWSYVPRSSGKYTIRGRVTVDGQVRQRTTTFTVSSRRH